MPAICPNWRSRGAATEAAMVTGLPPGSPAVTWMVGKSTWGSGATGRKGYEMRPAKASAAIRRAVAIGRRMNGSETFTACSGAGTGNGCGLAPARVDCVGAVMLTVTLGWSLYCLFGDDALASPAAPP